MMRTHRFQLRPTFECARDFASTNSGTFVGLLSQSSAGAATLFMSSLAGSRLRNSRKHTGPQWNRSMHTSITTTARILLPSFDSSWAISMH